MSPNIDSDIFDAWSFERDATADLIANENRRALEKANANGRFGTAWAATQLSDVLCPEVEAKAVRLIAKTREIFEAHGEVPTATDDNDLRNRFQKFLEGETAQVQAAVYKIERGGDAATRLAQTILEKLRVQSDHDFKLMLASLRTAAATRTEKSQMNFHNSNVQVGDNNTQNNQIAATVFRDILTKIDNSQHTEAEKAALKTKLSEFLTHPIIVGTMGAIASKVFK